MAEVLFIQYLQTQGYEHQTWLVASAGCWAYPDQPATKNAVQTVENLGCDLYLHSSQAVSENILQKFNLILCMEADHKNFIRRNFPEMTEKVFQFSEMIGKEFDIDDPISGGLENYADTAQELRSIMVSGFNKILKLSNY
jgi:protein-tyrosine phosphatase